MAFREGLGPKIFLDSASFDEMRDWGGHPLVRGFTTNPSLMKKSGELDYEYFVGEVLRFAKGRPVSFEVFSDDFKGMIEQAETLASWGRADDQIYVKIPVTDTKGHPTNTVIKELGNLGIRVNVTAVCNFEQAVRLKPALTGTPAIISIFAGRIADTLRDPIPVVKACVEILRPHSNVEVLWASSREVLNIEQAKYAKCDIITVASAILKKLPMAGKDLDEVSLDTVRQFHEDAVGLSL